MSGEPKMPTPAEMAKIQKERIKSDAKFVDGGADITPDGKIIPTTDQIKKIETEHEKQLLLDELAKLEDERNEIINKIKKIDDDFEDDKVRNEFLVKIYNNLKDDLNELNSVGTAFCILEENRIDFVVDIFSRYFDKNLIAEKISADGEKGKVNRGGYTGYVRTQIYFNGTPIIEISNMGKGDAYSYGDTVIKIQDEHLYKIFTELTLEEGVVAIKK